MGVDALATLYPGMNPYNFVMGNPIMAIDPDGNKVSPPDIRFRDQDGNVIATYYTDKVDDDVFLPVSSNGYNINLNDLLQLEKLDLGDIDVIGIGGNWDYTFVMGGGQSLEAIYFLDGEDKGSSEIFETTRQNVGFNGSAGVYGVFADYHGVDEQLSINDYRGKTFSISAGIKGPWIGGVSKFWAPKPVVNDGSGFKSLFNKDRRIWSGYNVGAGAGAGLQWSRQNTTVYE